MIRVGRVSHEPAKRRGVLVSRPTRSNLRDLEYLVAVADHLHFGKAALAVHVSQPTLSMQLKKLEESLGVQLFERTNKRVMLTPIGHDIVARARRTLNEAEQITRIAESAKDPSAGTLKLGIFPTLAPYLLATLMPRLRHAYPRLTLLLVEERTDELVRQLDAGTIDVAILAMPIANDHFANLQLFEEPFLLAVANSHPLASRKNVSVADMQGESVLLLEDGHCLRDQALEVCHLAGVGESANFRATSLETLRHMVAASQSITLMPKLATDARDTAMRYIPFNHPQPTRTIGLYWRTSSARSSLFTAIGTLVKNAYRNL
jgi:LysR family hydrogen peroxide-inducible transcriptional activator